MSGISAAIDLVDRVSGPLNRITASLYSTTSAFGSLDRASDIAFNPSGIQAVAQELYSYENRIQQLENELVGATRRLVEMEEQAQQTAMAGNAIKTAFQGAMSVLGAVGMQNLLEASDSLVQTTSRVNMMNDNLQSTPELMNMIYQSAQNARGSFDGMASVVARFGNNARDAFESSAEVVAFSELIQKQMTIAGAGTAESQNAMLQLSQALGSGVLRGDELNSIFEQAPNLIQNIADYLDVPLGTIRSMAAEGQLTADIVKNAVFSATDEINAKFNEMPMTWAQVGQSLQNTALKAFQPFLQAVNDVTKNERFAVFLESAEGTMYAFANLTLNVFNALGTAAAFVIDNWSVIGPLIGGVLTVMGIYLGVTKGFALVQLGLNGLMGAFHAVQTFVSIGYGVLTGSAGAAAQAQSVYNSALMASPITWIIIAMVALIATIYMVVGAINQLTGSTYSATGIICGLVAMAGAFILNTGVGLMNSLLQAVWTVFATPLLGIVEWILSAANGGFNSFGDAVANLIGQVISWFLDLGKVVTTIIDAIFGWDWTSGLNSLQSEVLSWGKNENAITISREAPTFFNRIEYGDARNTGYSFGAGIDNTIAGWFTAPEYNVDNAYTDTGAGSMLDGINNIAADTSNISSSIDISNENLKYLRDIAEREVVNRFTTAEIKIDMTNNNSISSETDIDGIITTLSDGLLEAMEAAAEGVH